MADCHLLGLIILFMLCNGSCLFYNVLQIISLSWVPLRALKGNPSLPLSSYHVISYRMLLFSCLKACWCPCHGTRLCPNRAHLKGDLVSYYCSIKKHMPHYQFRDPLRGFHSERPDVWDDRQLYVCHSNVSCKELVFQNSTLLDCLFWAPWRPGLLLLSCFWECRHCSPSTGLGASVWSTGQCGRVIIQTAGSLLNWFNPIPILMGISRETPVSALSKMWGLESEAFRYRQHCNYDDEWNFKWSKAHLV